MFIAPEVDQSHRHVTDGLEGVGARAVAVVVLDHHQAMHISQALAIVPIGRLFPCKESG